MLALAEKKMNGIRTLSAGAPEAWGQWGQLPPRPLLHGGCGGSKVGLFQKF